LYIMSNMYPDLNDDQNNGDVVAQKNYQSVAANGEEQRQQQKNKQKKNENCCILGAKIWISIVGGLNLLLGILVFAFSLYAKYGYKDYAQLSSTLPDHGIWMIFGFGIVLAICSVFLICAAQNYDKACFKIILVIFSFVLAILLIMEIVSGGIMAYSLGVIAMPNGVAGDAVADRIVQARDAAVNATWAECCIDNKPPYDLVNISKIDSVCLWPDTATAVQKACGSTNVQVCVCASANTYGAYLGLFVKSQIMWVSIVTIVLAVLLLGGLICTCVLICAKAKKKNPEGLYTNEEN